MPSAGRRRRLCRRRCRNSCWPVDDRLELRRRSASSALRVSSYPLLFPCLCTGLFTSHFLPLDFSLGLHSLLRGFAPAYTQRYPHLKVILRYSHDFPQAYPQSHSCHGRVRLCGRSVLIRADLSHRSPVLIPGFFRAYQQASPHLYPQIKKPG